MNPHHEQTHFEQYTFAETQECDTEFEQNK